MTKQRALGAIAVVLACAAAVLFPGTAGATQFGYTGAEQVWPVPSGVTAVHVVAVGAPGGGAGGGEGALVTADVPLPVGLQTLYIEVGGPGGTPSGGFNGGGAGGASSTSGNDGSGGGGATDVRTCSTASGTACLSAADSLSSRLVVAAGGGGASVGLAGGPAGEAGAGNGGQPGSQSAGGEDGLNDCATLPPDRGVFGSGAPGQVETEPLDAGGGGGGGWYGGGGGAGAGVQGCGENGAGGGGSSFVAGQPAPSFALDTSGTPQLTITAPVPVASGTPSVSGGVVDGDVLTDHHATWINAPTAVATQWERCDSAGANCSPIPDAVGQTYTLTPADVGQTVAVEETASNFYGTSAQPATSAPTSVVLAAPPPTLSASIRRAPGAVESVLIACHGLGSQVCMGKVTGTTRGRRKTDTRALVDVLAGRDTAGRDLTTTVEVVNPVAFSVTGGQSEGVRLGLNELGRRMLEELYTVPVTLHFSATSVTQPLKFTYPRISAIISYNVAYRGSINTVKSLTVTGIPSGAVITIQCRGSGCPFSSNTARPHRATDNLGQLFTARHLAAGSRIVVAIRAPNHVGEVVVITMRSSTVPSLAQLCQAPGARTPGRCA